MAGAVLEKRELYIDVAEKEGQLEDIFFYQTDFFADGTFRTREFLYQKEEPDEERTEAEEQPASPEPLTLFSEQWELFCREDVPTEVYATDAEAVTEKIFEPLLKQSPEFPIQPKKCAGREYMHDCVSMGRVVSMSAFDEEQYLSANIRRRMKERYHEYVDEIKADRKEHIFIRQVLAEESGFLMFITDADFIIKKQVRLNFAKKEELLAVRFREILALYPEADILVDAVTPEFYRLYHNMNQFMDMQNRRRLFSIESMLTALGKKMDLEDMVKTYRLYLKNHEEMRLGTFFPEQLYSTHSFYLPVQISSEQAWQKQFEKNTVWKQEGRENYCITAEGELRGKYIVKAGKEQFVLKLKKVSLQRYLKKYAVVRLDVENYCYPGEADKKRINLLAEALFPGTGERADSMELKLKNEKQAYSLMTVPVAGNESQLWLNGLLLLGKKNKKQGNKALVLTSLKEKMYCVENQEIPECEQIIQCALIRDGVFRKIEDAMAKAIRPETGDRPAGSLSRRQKKAVRELFDIYRYLTVSFGEGYETTEKEGVRTLWQTTEAALETTEVTNRLDRKFRMFSDLTKI